MDAAVIDVGSNTIRMVIGECRAGKLIPHRYEREIVRLAGDFNPQTGLAAASMERALTALRKFQTILIHEHISHCRVVGTAALRRAINRDQFIDRLYAETSLSLEVISGDEEARLTAQGVLSVVRPPVDSAIIVDIGGGSTEFICVVDGKLRFQKSYPVGVVRLAEECSSPAVRKKEMCRIVDDFFSQLNTRHLDQPGCPIVGTAGTVTTLAAIDLKLDQYDQDKINNHSLSVSCLNSLKVQLEQLPRREREQLAGMERGRGDLILPGLELVLVLLKRADATSLIVADAGLLEGAFLHLCSVNPD